MHRNAVRAETVINVTSPHPVIFGVIGTPGAYDRTFILHHRGTGNQNRNTPSLPTCSHHLSHLAAARIHRSGTGTCIPRSHSRSRALHSHSRRKNLEQPSFLPLSDLDLTGRQSGLANSSSPDLS